MKFIRFTSDGKERVGILKHDNINEIPHSMIEALNNLEKINPNEINNSNEINFEEKRIYHLNQVKINPPVSPSKVVCVGLNYRDHARELDMEIPDEPVIFIKPATSVIGPLAEIIYPEYSSQVDYEAEMAIIISKEAKQVKKEDVPHYIGGFTVLNDVTARDLQRKDVQWTRAKSFDTFCPLGPCIETDLDPHNQNISLRLNGELKQNSNTKNMIFSAEELVEFISGIMTLNPGDIIATGTPPGVGPLKRGDVVEAEVGGIGVLKNFVK